MRTTAFFAFLWVGKITYCARSPLLTARCSERLKAALSRVKYFLNFCHWFFEGTDLIPPNIKVTVFVLVTVFVFRAATLAATCGYSHVQIRAIGRWKFDAFCKYIRQSNIHVCSSGFCSRLGRSVDRYDCILDLILLNFTWLY